MPDSKTKAADEHGYRFNRRLDEISTWLTVIIGALALISALQKQFPVLEHVVDLFLDTTRHLVNFLPIR